MGKVYDRIDERLEEWIREQRLFFVATAPTNAGHVNVSPKGPIETLRVLGPRRVAYVDFVGSGAETLAHAKENGRIVIMLCAFEGPPRIVRLHGQATVVEAGEATFADMRGLFPAGDARGERSIVVVEVARIADSCGYGVPLMRYVGERPQRTLWLERKLRAGGPTAIDDYVKNHNARSIDDLPAISPRAPTKSEPNSSTSAESVRDRATDDGAEHQRHRREERGHARPRWTGSGHQDEPRDRDGSDDVAEQ